MYLAFSHDYTKVMGSGDAHHRWSAIFDTSHQMSIPSPWFMSADVDHDHLTEMSVSLTVDLPLTVDLLSVLSTLYFEESHYTQPTFKEWVAMLPLIRAACYIIYL